MDILNNMDYQKVIIDLTRNAGLIGTFLQIFFIIIILVFSLIFYILREYKKDLSNINEALRDITLSTTSLNNTYNRLQSDILGKYTKMQIEINNYNDQLKEMISQYADEALNTKNAKLRQKEEQFNLIFSLTIIIRNFRRDVDEKLNQFTAIQSAEDEEEFENYREYNDFINTIIDQLKIYIKTLNVDDFIKFQNNKIPLTIKNEIFEMLDIEQSSIDGSTIF